MTVDAVTGWPERPIAEAPTDGSTVLAKSRDGNTYMKVWHRHGGAWCLEGTRQADRPKPHTWLVDMEGPQQ